MTEIVSKQAAVRAAGKAELAPKSGTGKKRTIVLTSPDVAAWAQNDTFGSPIKLPKGSRILCDSYVSNAAMGASVTLDVGLRRADGTVIAAKGIADAVAVATAGRTVLNNGSLVAAGIEYITLEDAYVYATLGGAAPSANAQIRIEVSVLTAT